MSELDEQLTLAFADVFASQRSWFHDKDSSGGPGYFGVQVTSIIEDGSEIELVVTFREGHHYCCFEAVCHFADYKERTWGQVRECMDRYGLEHLPLPIIRKFRGIVEPGAVMQPGISGNLNKRFISDGGQYQQGPWLPILPKTALPDTK